MPAVPDISFRRPLLSIPVEAYDLIHPAVPEGALGAGGLEGLTILHVSDLHVRRVMGLTERTATVLGALERTPADLIVLTGDLMDEPGHEAAALEVLGAMSARWRARLGVFGVFGNHDTPHFQRACRAKIPGVRWIGGEVVDVPVGGVSLRLAGMDWPEDPLSLAMKFGAMGGGTPLLTLAHHPTSLIGASTIGLPILLAGHTHAGQVRLHPRAAPHTSSDLPMHLASGMLRLGETLCCVSRGLGDGVVEGLRVNCARQMPLYTLRRGAIQGHGGGAVELVQAW